LLASCDPTRRRQRDMATLTPQELAVTRLVAAGLSNRQAARELVDSMKTVEYHLSEQDSAFQRPSLTDKKLRALELRAGMPPRRGRKGTAAADSLKEVRWRERTLTEQAEVAYRQLVAGWQPKRSATKPH
jgi:transposase